MTCSKIGILIIFLCFFSCQNNSSEGNSKDGKLSEDIELLHLLFFKKEQKVELWATNSKNEFSLIRSYTSVRCEQTPIGIFYLNIDNIPLLVLETPNDFYGEKIGKEQFEEIYIVNKLGKNTNEQSIIFPEKDLNELLSFVKKDRKTRTFVFPNDLRKDGSFEACFGCPHRMAELYSSLELHLQQFVK
ncbi:MAG: hypothetical protein AB8F94_15705 [Saprospiraceae bacterium]